MTKKVLTYSWLAKKAMALHRKDPGKYSKLVTDCVEDFVPGLTVTWARHNDYFQNFRLRTASGKLYAIISGAYHNGEMYSHIETKFAVSDYRKRLTDKYLPITLPEGVRSSRHPKGNCAPCIYHNADGSVAAQGHWYASRRRGRSSTGSRKLVIRDRDGAFMEDSSDIPMEYPESLAFLGWFDAACLTRTEWLNSIKLMPGCDHAKVLAVAAKAYLAASRMTNKYSQVRMAMFPAERTVLTWQTGGRGYGNPPQAVMSRDDHGNPDMWFLPQLLLYWQQKSTYTGYCNPFAYLQLTIPPHGHPGMSPAGGAAPESTTARTEADCRYSYFGEPWSPLIMERAHHAVACWDSLSKMKDGHPKSGSYVQYGRGHSENVCFWPNRQDCVAAEVTCRYEITDNLPISGDTPVAMTPEEAVGMIEESLLLKSLPLC